ncbi:transcriptional regulator, LysR family [Sphingobium chlorophenolicum L-1]|uniref:Transcriptional regulator, LysR family n=4 Tax=Sphingobium chlorophenolicum TaxID=46429 RepID=F6F243_SPHCR|nr:LysR family transcriptional regulator [Sphingobium chlorophenolicum]AEG51609.1 transcriptional regulator, LysR family [Sphingobium chlorophenolicum L-1]KEQ53876.1 Transcriptional regulator, LysR family [Sphingobium chlorophenolicum]
MASRPSSQDHMASLSFFDLTVFDAMMRLRSVTLAADELDLPQSSMSRYVQALREHFSDVLFVRTRNGMVPTSVALSVARSVEETLNVYHSSLSRRRKFDPQSSLRTFRVAASDLGQLYIVPLMQRRSVKNAPNIHFNPVSVRKDKLVSDLEMGIADIVLGNFPALYASVREQTLFHEPYVCIAPARLVRNGQLSLSDFKSLYHIVVGASCQGHAHKEAEHRILEVIDPRRLRIATESFIVSALIAEVSDLVLTVPLSVARVVQSSQAAIVRPPIDLPDIAIKQYWHKRFDHDPGHEWLRTLVSDSSSDHIHAMGEFVSRGSHMDMPGSLKDQAGRENMESPIYGSFD